MARTTSPSTHNVQVDDTTQGESLMKVLVTGGAGFIGTNFVQRTRMTRPDWEITVLDALTYAGSLENLAPVADQIEFVHGNIADEGLVDRLVANADAVAHFA